MGDNFDVNCQLKGVEFRNPTLAKVDKDVKMSQPKERALKYSLEEAGDAKCRLSDKNVKEVEVTEPLLPETEVTPFAYSGTKLRPDAPPFTPECMASLIKSTSSEQPEVPDDESYFVSVELGAPGELITPELEYSIDTIQSPPREAAEAKDPEPMTFNLISASRTKPAPLVDVPAEETENAAVVVASNAENVAEEFRTESMMARGCARYFNSQFLLNNRLQIAVLIASSVISLVLVVYVLL